MCNTSTIKVAAEWVLPRAEYGIKIFAAERKKEWDKRIHAFNERRKWWRDRGCFWLRHMTYEEAKEYLWINGPARYFDLRSSDEQRLYKLRTAALDHIPTKELTLSIKDHNLLKYFTPVNLLIKGTNESR